MDITSKICGILLVIFSLISASAAEMSQATATREFRRCFPQSWVTDQFKVSCKDVQIAQYCNPDQSCRNMSKPGVSLEKGRDGVCLIITSCSYDSWFCEAQSYISDEEYKKNFTVSVCNQPTNTLPSPRTTSTSGTTSTLPSPRTTSTSGTTSTLPSPRTTSTLPSPRTTSTSGTTSTLPSPRTTSTSGTTSTLPSPGKNEPHSGSDEAVWGPIIGLIIFVLIIIGLIIYFCYKKVKCFRKAIRDIFFHFLCMNRAPEEEQDIELQKEKEKFLESPNHGSK